jgi:hypothetical protein
MGPVLNAHMGFDSREAAEFRVYVLAGCKRLNVDALRELADEIHECARSRRRVTHHSRVLEFDQHRRHA